MTNGVLCLAVTWASIVYFNSTPHPAPQAQIGSVAINLGLLGTRFDCADLQSAGMFSGLDSSKCDFDKEGRNPHLHLQDFSDHRLMGTLYLHRPRKVLWMHFYGEDVAAGRQRLEHSLQLLRARYPGRADAIRVINGPEQYQQLHRDW